MKATALSIMLIAAFLSGGDLMIPAGTLGRTAGSLGPGRKYTTVERMQAGHLRAVHDDRIRIAGARHEVADKTGYTDYRAVMHVHASDSQHTGGTRTELLSAAYDPRSHDPHQLRSAIAVLEAARRHMLVRLKRS